MTRRLLGLSAGAPEGSAEILLTEALLSARSAGADVELVRLEELHLPSGPEPSEPDDAGWFWEQLLAADGLIVSAPIYSRTIPARLKLLVDRLLGPNADRAIVQTQLEMRGRGEEPAMSFRADERVLRNRVAGFIAVGGAHTPQWHSLALPMMHLLTFSMQIAVVDQFLVGGAGTPQSIVLNDEARLRAARLGGQVAAQLGVDFEKAQYAGDPGGCPMCHLDVLHLQGRSVTCATCGARGRLGDGFEIEWTDLSTSVISLHDKHQHFQEILRTAREHGALRAEITERVRQHRPDLPVLRPERQTATVGEL